MSESHIARLPLSDVPSAVLAHCPSALAGLPINVFPIPGHAELSDDFHAAPCILVAHDGHGQRWYRRGEQVKHLHTAPRMIEMYEKGLAFDHCRWVGQTGRTVSIEFLDEDVEALTHGELQTLNLPTRHELFDERLSRLTLDLAAEALCGMPSGQLFAQATSVALIATLASRYVDAVPAVPTRGRLAPLQQRRLVELIEHQVGADLSLTRMADEVGLSPHHFVRVFKTTFGVTPHQYVQERRVQLAAAALRTEDQRSLAEIALAFGFGNQSHMTTVLKQRIGVTPGKLRLRAGENLLNS